MAEMWEAHAALMGKDKDSQAEAKGLRALAKEHKAIAASLKKASENMKKAASWPAAPHDMQKMMSDPKLTTASQKLIGDPHAGAVIITAGADVQADRIECELVAFGRDEESWSLAYVVFLAILFVQRCGANSSNPLCDVRAPCGRESSVAAACVDAGFQQATVQAFCVERLHRRIYATKGAAASARSGRVCTAKERTTSPCGLSAWMPPKRRSTGG